MAARMLAVAAALVAVTFADARSLSAVRAANRAARAGRVQEEQLDRHALPAQPQPARPSGLNAVLLQRSAEARVKSAGAARGRAPSVVGVYASEAAVEEGTPESPENAATFMLPAPTVPPHKYMGTYCRGLGCMFRRATGEMGLTTPIPMFGIGMDGGGNGPPYMCRGLGCPKGIEWPKMLDPTGWVDICVDMVGSKPKGGGGPATDQASIDKHLEGKGGGDNTGPDLGSGFEAECMRSYPAEKAYCGGYADVLRAAAAVAQLPPDASPKPVCQQARKFIDAMFKAETNLELSEAAMAPDAPHSVPLNKSRESIDGEVPQSATMYELFPPSPPLAIVEVSGPMLNHCADMMDSIIKPPEPLPVKRQGTHYVTRAYEWCEEKQNYSPDPAPGVWRPDWSRGTCEGVQNLMAFALRDDFENVHEMGDQEVCRKLFEGVGLIHRINDMIRGRIVIQPGGMLLPPIGLPGPPTLPPPPDPPVAPTLPPGDSAQMKALLQKSEGALEKAKKKLLVQYNEDEDKDKEKKEIEGGAEVDVEKSGGDAPAPVMLPSVGDFDFLAVPASLSRLQRLRGLGQNRASRSPPMRV